MRGVTLTGSDSAGIAVAGPLRARHVVDTRPPPASQRDGATLFQCFAGRELLLDAPGMDERRVELMTDMRADAEGFVFTYVLPLTATRVLVEATRFSRRPLPAGRLWQDLDALLARRGWSGAERLRAAVAAGASPRIACASLDLHPSHDGCACFRLIRITPTTIKAMPAKLVKVITSPKNNHPDRMRSKVPKPAHTV